MPPVGFETTTPAGERPQTYALDRAATGTGISILLLICFLFTVALSENFFARFSFSFYICFLTLSRN